MAKKTGDYQIPFDADGHQLHYPETYTWRNGVRVEATEWKDNYEFDTTLRITGMERGRSAAYFHALTAENKFCTMFMTDLFDCLPYFEKGVVKGRFTFTKRGCNYGIKLARS